MHSIIRKVRFVLLIAGALAVLGSSAQAGIVEVGTCINGYQQFKTIQSAINGSPPGTVIDVCPGTYLEQISINETLTLHGVLLPGASGAVIAAPSGGMVQNATDLDTGAPIAAQVLVYGPGISVAISDLAVDGANNGISGCSPDLQGILFQNASGVINHITTRNQYLAGSGLGGCQSGEGIYVQTASGDLSNVTVENSSVHAYQKNGITGNDSGTTLQVVANRVQGLGLVPAGDAAQNGIQLGFGAKGSITANFVVDDVYGDPASYIATGILLYDTASSAVLVNANDVANTQGAVVVATDQSNANWLGNGVTVKANNIFATANYDAIDVCTDSNSILNNNLYDSAQSGVHLDASCSVSGGEQTGNNNNVISNTIVESGCAGILVDSGTSGNAISPDTFLDVPNTVLNGRCPAVDGSRHKNGPSGKAIYSPKGRK